MTPFTPPEDATYPNHTPAIFETVWGNGPNEKADIYVDPQVGSGRAVLFWLHGGAGTHGDLRQISVGGNGLGSALLHYLHTTAKPFPVDVVAVGYEKAAWLQATQCTHIPQYTPTEFPTYFPANVDRISQLWGWAASCAVSYGWDEQKFHLGGVSHGGVLAMLARLANAAPVKSLVIESPIPDYRDPHIWWMVGRGMTGVLDQATWDAVSDFDKAAMSAVLRLSPNYAPMFLANASVGNGQTPYGLTGEGANVHDQEQLYALIGELALQTLAHEWTIYARTALNTPKLGQQIAAQAWQFMLLHS